MRWPRIGVVAVSAAALAVTLPALAPAQETPLEFLRRLIEPTPLVSAPPANAIAAPVASPVVDPVPLPRLRPSRGPDPAPLVAYAPAAPSAAASTGGSCLDRLRALGVTANAVEPVKNGACGIANPVSVRALGFGHVTIAGTATLDCKTAETFARWTTDIAMPVARDILGADLTGYRIAASYACRTRNSQRGARLSEHALGRAVDISAFEVAGHGWLEVGQAEGREQLYLSTLRRTACGPFKTVLGPGSDAYHSDHFHFDTAQRRNGSSYCK